MYCFDGVVLLLWLLCIAVYCLAKRMLLYMCCQLAFLQSDVEAITGVHRVTAYVT